MSQNVLILDAAADRERYRPNDQWRRYLRGTGSTSLHLPSGEGLPSLDEFTHVIVTGSEHSALGSDDWYDVECDAIREAHDRGLSILGSCFGHQMLVRALSGIEYVRAAEAPEIGWGPIEITRPDPLLDGFPNPWWAFHLHFDEVVDPPEPWRVLGRTETCPVHVIRFGDRPIWGIQSHPEFETSEARAALEWVASRFEEPIPAVERALAQAPRDDRLVQEIVDRFLDL
jgi:GMP synthase-like glutamine amidotransferase